MTAPHRSIMVDEVISHLKDVKIGIFFDGTLGAGGHAKAILEAHPGDQTVHRMR